MRLFAAALLASLTTITIAAACLPDNPIDEGPAGSDETGETGEGGDERVEDGLLGCPSGEACTIVAVSQTIDDRVDLFTGAGSGPRYRGALELDLKPNPGGDISGENLDEPYGLGWDGSALHVLVGHYPTRELGSLLSFPAASLAGYAPGAMVPSADWFAGGTSTSLGVGLTPLDRTEPLSLLVRPSSGELLVATFANDLMLAESTWTAPSELLWWSPEGELEALEVGCTGAWSIVALDEDGDALALACDGDEAVAILDGDPLAPRCVADIPFSDKRVRYLAPDGLGGVIVGENPVIISASEDARIWWFDGDCKLRGFSVLDGATSWELRELIPIPSAASPRWLLARADGEDRGVIILAGDPGEGSVSPCGRVEALDEADAWTAAGGTSPLRPHALALTEDGFGLALGVGPAAYDNAGPGYGSVWWVELDEAEDACDRAAVELVELGSFAPAVDPQLPQTWRRAPDVLEIIEVAP
ncbi:MAG: hypothetical protein R6X02_31845 [Enhygromyxa sp.]